MTKSSRARRASPGSGASIDRNFQRAAAMFIPRRFVLSLSTILLFSAEINLSSSHQDYFNLASAGLPSPVHAIEQTSAKLPCDLYPPAPSDKVVLVLWYKKTVKKPIFSFDVRGRDFLNAKKWTDGRYWGPRAVFRPDNLTHPLTIQHVALQDEGLYRCRVDFKFSPTRNSIINLTVIVPPRPPDIYDREGRLVKSIVGPYNEGEDLYLMCQSAEGRPPPQLTWWRGDMLVDSSFDIDGSDGTVKNDITVRNLQRQDLQAVFACKASNNNQTAPATNEITLDMNFKPLYVSILNKMQDPTQTLSTSKEYEILCQAVGSRPPPRMTWWLGNFRLRNDSKERTTGDLNTTTSILAFRPELNDIGKALTCRAEHVDIPDSAKDDTWELIVHYKPIVTLKLGRSLERDKLEEGIEEGKDVYFECGVIANPSAFEVLWKHNGKILRHNKADRVIISNHSLVLQQVTRRSAGSYSCHAINLEGEGTSAPFRLKVKYAPICDSDQAKKVFRISRMEKATVECKVKSEPPSTSFRWAFNNTADIVEIPNERFYVEPDGQISRLQYSPLTDLDYGSLQCWAANEIGSQKVPCVYHIIPVRKPDPPYNCSLFNYTPDSIDIQCLEGYDGGLPQLFHLEVHDEDTQELLANFSSSTPSFQMTDLTPGRGIILTIYASNSKGSGQSIVLPASTPSAAAKRTSKGHVLAGLVPRLGLTPLLALLLGIVSCLVFVAIAIVLAVKCRKPSTSSESRSHRKLPTTKEGLSVQTSAGGSLDAADMHHQQADAPGNVHRYSRNSESLLDSGCRGPPGPDMYEMDEKSPDIIPEPHIQHKSCSIDLVNQGRQKDLENLDLATGEEMKYQMMTHQMKNPAASGTMWTDRKGSAAALLNDTSAAFSQAVCTLPRNFKEGDMFMESANTQQPSMMSATLHGTVLVGHPAGRNAQIQHQMMKTSRGTATLNRFPHQHANIAQYPNIYNQRRAADPAAFGSVAHTARIPPPTGFGNSEESSSSPSSYTDKDHGVSGVQVELQSTPGPNIKSFTRQGHHGSQKKRVNFADEPSCGS